MFKILTISIPIISSVHPLGTGQYLREYMAGAFTVGPVFFVSLSDGATSYFEDCVNGVTAYLTVRFQRRKTLF